MRMKYQCADENQKPLLLPGSGTNEDDVFLSKAEETYEAFLAELSKVLIKVLWKMSFRKNFIWLVFL